jgi:hypothetical protein
VPVLPIVIDGTGNALPKAGYVLQGRHPITVRILDPVLPDPSLADTPAAADQLAERVRSLIARQLGQS